MNFVDLLLVERRVVNVFDVRARKGLGTVADIIRAGYADIECANIAPIPIVTGAVVDAVELQPTSVERSAIVDPHDQRLRLRIDRGSRVRYQTGDSVLERLACCRQQVAGAARAVRKLRIVGWHQEGEIADIRAIERVRGRVAESRQQIVDLDDVIRCLDIEASEEISRRRVVDPDASVGGQFGRQATPALPSTLPDDLCACGTTEE